MKKTNKTAKITKATKLSDEIIACLEELAIAKATKKQNKKLGKSLKEVSSFYRFQKAILKTLGYKNEK